VHTLTTAALSPPSLSALSLSALLSAAAGGSFSRPKRWSFSNGIFGGAGSGGAGSGGAGSGGTPVAQAARPTTSARARVGDGRETEMRPTYAPAPPPSREHTNNRVSFAM
jgi:hypothetical protein